MPWLANRSTSMCFVNWTKRNEMYHKPFEENTNHPEIVSSVQGADTQERGEHADKDHKNVKQHLLHFVVIFICCNTNDKFTPELMLQYWHMTINENTVYKIVVLTEIGKFSAALEFIQGWEKIDNHLTILVLVIKHDL